jgi:hypothetical protein
MEKQLSLAAQEATFAYHTAVHNLQLLSPWIAQQPS